ncbi:uncharacterized protein [Henckelia pumila]|uniref:uncharacterized protein n=1 Tax=Henckelia pumila TaxID=405737 RepID=UPI003C6DD889
MFPSIHSSDSPLESLFRRAIFCEQNPISKPDDDPPSSIFSNFPSPFFDEHELPLNQILSHNLQVGGSGFLVSHGQESRDILDPAGKDIAARFNVVDASKSKEKSPENTNPSPASKPVMRRRSLGVVPRNRAGKKDRHSKICTAQGVRDRRMRLSLQIARKFFDLQDLLGYDKASKTIEWLFSKSKKAIKELAKDHSLEGKNNSVSDAKSESFVSECEVLSGIEENSNTDQIKESSKVTSRNAESPPSISKRSGRKPQKTTTKSTLRESRDEARARARCRTREKMMMKGLGILSQWNKSNPNYADVQKVGSSNIPFEEPNSGFQERASNYNNGDYHSLPDVGTIENLLASSSTSSISCPNPDFQCPAAASAGNVLGFLGNWDLLNNEKTSASQIYSAVTHQVSLVGNPNPIFLASPNFPFHQ